MKDYQLNCFQKWGIKQGEKHGVHFVPYSNWLQVKTTGVQAMTYAYVDHLCGIDPI